MYFSQAAVAAAQAVFAFPTCSPPDAGYNLSNVVTRALEVSSRSWQYATLSEALLELYNPEYSVFSKDAFPGGRLPKPPADILSLSYAAKHIRIDGASLADDDDPASLGVSALLLGISQASYTAAAARQFDHFSTLPQLSNGAISHRDEFAESWSDSLYMVPPFYAYYAVATSNVSLMAETVRQCGLHRDLLQNRQAPNAYTYWRHILNEHNSTWRDEGIWSTGNAWPAAGMARVLATLLHWKDSASQLQQQKADLTEWILEIIDGARTDEREPSSGLLRNYLNDSTWFGEVAGTALLASVVYRMAVLVPNSPFATEEYITWADDSRRAVARHVSTNGTLSPAVDPLVWDEREPCTSGSPEGQNFAILLYAAYRDYLYNSG